MAFAEGERNQGLQLLADIMRWCPERFIEMMREHTAPPSAPDEPPEDEDAIG